MEVVAVDIGGTHARFAIAEVEGGRVVSIGEPVTQKTAEHGSFQLAWQASARALGREMPRAAAIAIALRWLSEPARRIAALPALRQSAPASALTAPVLNESVLVVDDSATVRAFMRIKLAPFHFDVDFAENGEQAIEMAQAKTYTCIFLDIMMPGIDGYEVCKRIKNNSDTKKTAVVMLTSKNSMFDKFRGNWAGCDAYLGKPVPEDDLLATIARFLPSARS